MLHPAHPSPASFDGRSSEGTLTILHGLRLASPRKPRWRTATFATIGLTFVKIACRIEELKTKINLSFGAHLPQADVLCHLTARLAALGP
jgi:hypothetical protein